MELLAVSSLVSASSDDPYTCSKAKASSLLLSERRGLAGDVVDGGDDTNEGVGTSGADDALSSRNN